MTNTKLRFECYNFFVVENIHFKPPSIIKRALEKVGREVEPADICLTRGDLDRLYKEYPDMAGDGRAIGSGDDGNCQSWRNNPGWWKAFLNQLR